MKSGSQFKNLLKELGRDPRLKPVITNAKRQKRGKGGAEVEGVTGIVLLLLTIASRFLKKKNARALDELMDVIYLLIRVSVLLSPTGRVKTLALRRRLSARARRINFRDGGIPAWCAHCI